MNRTHLNLICLLLYGCNSQQVSIQPQSFQDYEVIEVPVEFVHEFGPFEASFRRMSRRNKGQLGNEPIQMDGVPDWPDPHVRRIILDRNQYVHQNVQNGLIDSTRFRNRLSSPENVIDQNIRCYTHIVFDRDADSNILLKVDADGDGTFDDEPESRPVPAFPWRDDFIQKHNLDSVVKSNTVMVQAEFFIEGEVQELEVPLLLLATKGGEFAMSMPIHAKATFLGSDIRVSGKFGLSFYHNSYIVIDPEQKSGIYPTGTYPPTIETGEFLLLSGNYFQNLGLDFHSGVLKLQKMPNDTVLFSSQAGFNVIPFEARTLRDQRLISLDDYSDKYLFMEFWGTWCAPCVEDVPNLVQAYSQIDTSRVAFLGIAQDDPDRVLEFLGKDDIPWDQVVSSDENDLVKRYNVTGFPTSFLIDPNGLIVAKGVRGDKLLDTLSYYLD